MNGEEFVAAADLGSNSFHMIVARLRDGQMHIVDRVREAIRLGAGLDGSGNLTPEVQDQALDCLRRFGQRVREVSPGRVRAVGTNALRRAKNALDFLDRARLALGHPIEIISGKEEARLIYLGMAQTAADDPGRRLVIDVGGGSTECIIGERFEILQSDSLFMGCVSYSLQFFPDGVLTKERFQEALVAAKIEAQSIERSFTSLGWQTAFGCSGTILSIDDVVRANAWARRLTPKGLKRFRKAMIAKGHVGALDLPGLAPERRDVIPGGLAILEALFDILGIERMHRSPGALREGLLFDLLGRIRHEDTRDRTIRWFCERYGVDREQVARVERTARRLLVQVEDDWGLAGGRAEQVLSWAAHLHEVGLSLSHTGYHKHSAYIVTYADMAGFSREDQRLLGAVIMAHRRKVKKDVFSTIPPSEVEWVRKISAIFRLAAALHRTRSTEPMPKIRARVERGRLHLGFPWRWLHHHPLTKADLDQHAAWLRSLGVEVILEELS